MILSVNNITKQFNEKMIIRDASFFLNEYDKAALIGINGSGKSTLIKMIMGDVTPDEGVITISKDTSIGYLPQNALLDSDNSIYEEVLQVKAPLLRMEAQLREMEESMSDVPVGELDKFMENYHQKQDLFNRMNGLMINSEVYGTLKGLGFDESSFEQPVNTLSGGQKTRVALAKILVGTPDLIILDEPTNHLDMNSIVWLENYLLNYKGTVLIVSHDRYFLDKIVNKVIEIENTSCTSYTGNYTDFAAKKEIVRIARLNSYMNQQRDINHQKEVIEKLRSFNREKSIRRAESRQKMLDKMEVIEKDPTLNDKMQIVLTPRIESGNDVLKIENLSKSYGDNLLFENVEMLFRKGEHVAIIGDNGTGKTTLLKILNGLEDADDGMYRLGSNVVMAYYDQEHHVLNDNNTIFDEIQDAYPTLTNTEIRNTLAAFLFYGDDVFKQIGSLSGGEKGRISLAKLMLSEANLLILDEPTNHLDISSKEILETTLNNYTGTVIYVSHDRYFINKTADRILELADHNFINYHGNFDYYMEKREQLRSSSDSVSASSSGSTTTSDAPSKSKEDWKAMKEEAARQKKQQKELEKTEAKISELEGKLNIVEASLADPAYSSNVGKLIEFQKEKEVLEEELEKLMEYWEELQD
ncbi:MAG: ABC-F family ATP-binding cassette domain-containing protein [Lachnospiraceae bacterium]|nr:ABC-F family ATP-binding cassette domain-containing protein [Lachnospiraceae bacterium]